MDCDEYIQRRVKLGYVADSPTSVQLVDSIGNQVFDLRPIVQAGETETSIALLDDIRRIRYYPEIWTRTEGKDGCYYDICIPDIAALMDLNELRNVDFPETLENGDTLVYNVTTKKYEMFNLYAALETLGGDLEQLNAYIEQLERIIRAYEDRFREYDRLMRELTETVGDLVNINNRVTAIEDAIYNWETDKTMKIPRGNINITSGGANSGNGIYTRTPDSNEDLNGS